MTSRRPTSIIEAFRLAARAPCACTAGIAMAMATAAPGAQQEPSSWIAVCPSVERSADGTAVTTYETPDGARRSVAVFTSAPAGCTAAALPVPAADIVWVRLVAPASAPRLQRGFLLQGGEGVPSAGSELIPLEDEPAAAPRGETARARPATVRPAPRRALWAWRRDLWVSPGTTLFADGAAWNVGTIYVALHLDADGQIADAERLRAFIVDAGTRGLQVWAVEGDPRAVTSEGRASMVRRARAIASFNAPGPSRLAGVQYDIEPYLISGYALDEDRWNDAYVATVRQLARAVDLPIELAVPFWWLQARVGSERVMDLVAPSIASVAVMDYRTDAGAIERFAHPWLEWGEARGRAVRIALEAGPLPDEPRHHFRPARAGTAWTVTVGEAMALVLLRTPRANPAGGTFALVSRSIADASVITFHGRLDRLRELLPQLEQRLGAFSSFAGIALHEVVR